MNRSQILLGVFIVLLGILLLIGNLLNINVWALFFPLALIGAGLWIILRPRMVAADTAVTQKFIGDIDRFGEWEVGNEDFTLFIGDINLNMDKAFIPKGDTHLRFSGFVGDIKLTIPKEVAVSIESSAFVSDINLLGTKKESFLSNINIQSDNYELAERCIHIHASGFVNAIKVR